MSNSGMRPQVNRMRMLEDIDYEVLLSSEEGLKFTSELAYDNGAIYRGQLKNI
jgi:hypothetical protein